MRKTVYLNRNKKVKLNMLAFCFAGLGILNSVQAQISLPKVPEVKKPAVIPYEGDTFEKIKKAGKIIIGNRSGSVPISYFDANKKPIGYGIDICLEIAEKIKAKIDMPNLPVEFVEVTSDSRIPSVISGKVDLECGSTTNNAKRRKDVSFSIPYYIAGVRILAKKDSGINGLNDLRNKTIAFGKGTTSIDIMKTIDKQRVMHITLDEEKDFKAAFKSVENGKSQAFILDDLLLFGEKSQSANPENYDVVGDFLSVEPLAIMLRKNEPNFKIFVDATMYSMIVSGKVEKLYYKWFQSPIPPKNQNLNIPLSSLLRDNFRLPTDIVGN